MREKRRSRDRRRWQGREREGRGGKTEMEAVLGLTEELLGVWQGSSEGGHTERLKKTMCPSQRKRQFQAGRSDR